MSKPVLARRIILVEDETALRAVLEKQLHTLSPGVRVECAETGEKALELMATTDDASAYDVILSDIMLKGDVTGVDFWQKCRERFPETPFVFMSGLPADFYEHLIDDPATMPPFLAKPFSTREFRSMLKSALGKR